MQSSASSGLPPTGVTDPTHTGIGVVPANNQQPVIITTPQGDAGLLVPQGGAPATVVVTVTNAVIGGLNSRSTSTAQTIELTASQDVTLGNGGVTVALCVSAEIGQTRSTGSASATREDCRRTSSAISRSCRWQL